MHALRVHRSRALAALVGVVVAVVLALTFAWDDGDGSAPLGVPTQGAGAPIRGFGVNLGFWLSGDATPVPSLRAMRSLRVEYERSPLSWNGARSYGLTPGPVFATEVGNAPEGSPLAPIDRRYTTLVGAGITPIFVVQNAPPFASTLRRCLAPGANCPPGWERGVHMPAPRFYPNWRVFVAAVAKRYPQAVIEGPNEPDLAWVAHRREPRSYTNAVEPEVAAEVQCELHRAIRDAGLPNTVLSMAMGDLDYARRYLPLARRCHDAFSWHVYTNNRPTRAALEEELDALQAVRRRAGDTERVWVTETGFTYVPQPGKTAANEFWERRYARASVDTVRYLRSRREIGPVLIHTLRDAPIDGVVSPVVEDHFGLFERDWSAKPRGCALVALRGGQYAGCT